MSAAKKMTFKRFGRSYHLHVATADDMPLIRRLDEAHWVATGAPIETISADRTFLKLLDLDSNGRVLCYEIIAAVAWLFENLRDTGGVTAGSKALRLDAINLDSPQGKRIADSAAKMLSRLGQDDATEITLDQVRQIRATVEAMPVSEAGVILPAAAQDTQTRQFILDMIATVGGAAHPNGSQGVTEAKLEQFLAEARAFRQWAQRGDIPPGKEKTDVMPLGADTPEAFDIISAVRDKIDQYFAQCEAAALDARLAEQVGMADEQIKTLDLGSVESIEQIIEAAPLARPNEQRLLRFDYRINPHYRPLIARLREKVLEPMPGGAGKGVEELSQSQWRRITSAFDAYAEWIGSKVQTGTEALGAAKLREYLDEGFPAVAAVRSLLQDSRETAFVLDNIRLVEKLILYQAHMLEMVNNFVSFPHLYDPDSRAMFEMGTLVMDGRRFNLAVKVNDRTRHSQVAKTSNMYVLYVEISPPGAGQKYEVALPVTSGNKGNLGIHKRGIFKDISGVECDARVVYIIENPISIGEALVAPFQRIARLITGKIESLTSAAEKKMDSATAAAMTQVEGAAKSAQPQKNSGGMLAGGLLMGGGVAIAALGSALAYIIKTLSGLNPWVILAGVVGAILAVLLPTSIVAFLKLRRRDLSAILEGSGWAINARMRLTRKQQRYFAQQPRNPASAKLARLRRLLLVVILIAAAAVVAIGAYFSIPRPKADQTTPPTQTQQQQDNAK